MQKLLGLRFKVIVDKNDLNDTNLYHLLFFDVSVPIRKDYRIQIETEIEK